MRLRRRLSNYGTLTLTVRFRRPAPAKNILFFSEAAFKSCVRYPPSDSSVTGGADERCGAAADADDDGYRCEHEHDEDDVHRLLILAHETVDHFWRSWQFVVDALTAVQTAASRLGVRDCALSMCDHAWLVLAMLLRPFVRTPGFFERRCLARALRISPTSGR